jgi:preprotein translocase subunit YajC
MSQQIVLLLFQTAGGSGGLFQLLIPMLMVFVLFYFLIIIPQRKRQRAVDQMLNELKPGDKVVTNGGIYGTIVSLNEDKRRLVLKISENPVVRIEVARTSVSGLQDAPEEKK